MAETKIHEFSMAERDRRWSKIRAKMAQGGLDCLVIRGISSKWDSGIANIRYVSQIGGNGEEAMAVFPKSGDPIILVWSPTQLEWWPTAQSWVKDIRLGVPDWGEKVAAIINDIGFARGRIGVVGIGGRTGAGKVMSYEIYKTILDSLPDATFVPASRLMEEVRIVKSAEEIAFLEKSAALCDTGINAMLATAKPGKMAHEIYGEILGSIFKAGGESPMFLMYEADREPRHALRFPSNRALESGYMILQEISPKYAGYWSQAMVPVSLGKPKQIYLDLTQTTVEAYNNALQMCRPGVSARQLAEAINKPIVQAGHMWLRSQWQGLGLEQIEGPSDTHTGATASEEEAGELLEEGMVLGLQPMAGTKDGRYGVQIGDTVVVTKNGARRLGKSEMKFYVL
jgi:Xaa-Pro aminopeptidase